MGYIDGFVLAVPTADKQTFIDFARKFDPIFIEFGATRVVEGWGDDVPAGKQTDFHRPVQAKDTETVVFSWIEWPDKATCDAAAEKMENDPRWEKMGDMPFDGKRLIYAGFETIFSTD